VAAAVLYWAVIIPLHKPVFQVLYRGRYMDVAYLLPALALGQIFWSATFGPALALRAMESPRSVFVALGVATAASLAVGVPLTWFFGLRGAIWGSNAADVFSLAALMFMFRRKLASFGSAGVALGSRWVGAKGEVQPTMVLEASEEI
jgi:O-antigen/teichoic acid export membrane protein